MTGTATAINVTADTACLDTLTMAETDQALEGMQIEGILCAGSQ